MKPLIETLMERDEISREEATRQVEDAAQDMLDDDLSPEEILESYFGLEPDWVLDLLEYAL